MSSSPRCAPYAEPFTKFAAWLAEAKVAKGEMWPNAMTLATSSALGLPNARIVLMQRHEIGRIAWYTNYNSQKGRELAENPRAAAVFYWNKLQRQCRMMGTVSVATAEESDAVWAVRKRNSKLLSIASDQSERLDSPDILKERIEVLKQQMPDLKDDEIPRPSHCGLHWLHPNSIEFWSEPLRPPRTTASSSTPPLPAAVDGVSAAPGVVSVAPPSVEDPLQLVTREVYTLNTLDPQAPCWDVSTIFP